ncbi:MAG: hypothetical protein ABI855_06665 [Bacteroidota bacterium]
MSKTFIFLLILFSKSVFGQELFPNNEPASTLPKNVFGARLFTETYNEAGTQRYLFALRAMYGLLPKLTVMVTATASNHHDKNFPKDLITHTHPNYYSTIISATNIKRGVKYPFLFNGFNLYGKYRFITIDGEKKHFRMALYGEWSNVTAAHDETEPNLLDDTKGWGGGLITTYLKKRFAVSLTSGMIFPGYHIGVQPDPFGGSPIPITLHYGRAIKYNLSFGYLLSPNHYVDYDQPNWNIYLEFSGKAYKGAKVYQYDLPVEVATNALNKGYYVDIQPGIQKIYNSNLRIDFSVSLNLLNRSYSHFYPMYMLGLQKYFY